ncbi:MAG: hypothetical protein WA655_20040 [Candidatus Korobacteraceae bacterium]
MPSDQPPAELRRDHGSFRDPDGYILRQGERIFRVVLPSAAERWRRFASSGLAAELQSAGLLVPTQEVTSQSLLSQLPAGSIVLEHELIPFISYPYEWTFEMLRDAALLHLEILGRALPHRWILKDATAYNVQFRGVTPLFIDVLSFAPVEPGEVWAGYNQFCRMMLYPLMLEAYKGIPFQPWLRSELEGIDPVIFSRMFRGLEHRRRGVLSHVKAQAYLQQKFASAGHSVRKQIKAAGMTPQMIARNVQRLRKLLLSLRLSRQSMATTWSDYSREHYSDDALSRKEAFVRESLGGRNFQLAWDLGCNDGRFSRIVAESARTVVAMDSDAGSIDRLYSELRREQRGNILPLLMNLANPSPAQGWASVERASLTGRGKPGFTLALALVHHLVISANVPLAALVEWLADNTRELVIEFIGKDDPMLKRLLLNKDDTYADYEREPFERHLEQRFDVRSRADLPGGTRFLYHATVR